jgi:hypothetical protein
MLRLRLLDDASPEHDPQKEMAALADRFPGALREIDELSMDEIRSRIGALDDALREPSSEQPWMAATARFHALTRGVLVVKRWLGKKKLVDDAVTLAFLRELGGLRYAEDARSWAPDLARVASPPRGRVTDLVFERIAAALGVSAREARHLVFGPSRRERR